MIFKFEYKTEDERAQIINSNKDKELFEEQIITEGNFLVFTDMPIEKETIYINVPESEFIGLKAESETLNLAIIDLYEIILG